MSEILFRILIRVDKLFKFRSVPLFISKEMPQKNDESIIDKINYFMCNMQCYAYTFLMTYFRLKFQHKIILYILAERVYKSFPVTLLPQDENSQFCDIAIKSFVY